MVMYGKLKYESVLIEVFQRQIARPNKFLHEGRRVLSQREGMIADNPVSLWEVGGRHEGRVYLVL